MKKNSQLQKKLQEIYSHKCFEELEPFKNVKTWKSLDEDDRHVLAHLFVMQGEKQLEKGDNNALESFEIATKVSPDNSDIYYCIGNAYAIPEMNVLCLKRAEDAFQKALKLNPAFFNAWLSLANVYNHLGMLNNDSEPFVEAEHCFQQAYSSSQNESADSKARLYWHWALNWYSQGKQSGEAVDFYTALEKFRYAAELGLQDKEFWISYGDTMAELATLIDRNDLFYEVIELYRNGVRQAFDYFEGWLNLGCAFERLFENDPTGELLHQSSECFKMASQINENSSLLWLKWAQLTTTACKLQGNIDLLNDSFEKFAKAHSYDDQDPMILALWGEALLLYGSHKEDIEILREAQEKITRSLEIEPESAETRYIYACSFYELGRYFNQEDYFHQAIEKYQQALSLKQNEPLVWYGLANTYYAIGDMRGEESWIEKALSFYSKVLEFKGHSLRPLWNDWGVALMRLSEMSGEAEHVQEAIEKFEHVISAKPEEWEEDFIELEWLYNYGCALDFLGELTDDMGSYEKAVLALAKVVQLDPEYTYARYNLALALAHLGELAMDVECFHKAIEQFQILLTQDNEDEMGWCDYGLTLLHLAQLIQDPVRPDQGQKLHEIAESKFMHASALGCTQAYYNLACLHALQNNASTALYFLERSASAGVLPGLDTLLQDEWLDNLRTLPEFRQFINRINTKNMPESK